MFQTPKLDTFDDKFYEFRRRFFADDDGTQFESLQSKEGSGLLTIDEINSIWIQVESEFGGETAEMKLEIALAFAEGKIASNFESDGSDSSNNCASMKYNNCVVTFQELNDQVDKFNDSNRKDDIYSRRDFAYFMHLFEGQLEDEVLRNIWSEECRLYTIRLAEATRGGEEEEEREHIAVVESACAFALDRLEIGDFYSFVCEDHPNFLLPYSICQSPWATMMPGRFLPRPPAP